MNRKGVSVITLAFIILIIAFLGLVFTSMLTTSSEESVNEYNSTRALYIAEGGAEAVMMYLNQPPASTYWLWNNGYLDKPLGDGTVDVEVLQYENRDATLSGTEDCPTFQSSLATDVGANNARTVYITLTWSSSNSFGLELYNADVSGSCASPPGGNLIASVPASTVKPKVIRYRIPDPPPTPVTYTARVTGTNGVSYELRISHPDESGFTSSDWRSVIALGEMNQAKREVFVAFKK